MEIKKIEPTPSPNTLKITLDFNKEDMKSKTYQSIEASNPAFINGLLNIKNIKAVFHALDFISVDKNPSSDWNILLPEIKQVFASGSIADVNHQPVGNSGEKQVEVLEFKNIPYQIKITYRDSEVRKQLDLRFIDAMLDSQNDDDNVILLRRWVDYGIRYGTDEEIINTVKEEIDALYPDERLQELVEAGKANRYEDHSKQLKRISIETYISTDDWKERYRMLDHYPTPDLSDIPFLKVVLSDDKPQLRRLAVMFLGMIESRDVLPLLDEAMEDRNIAVRRTAGDTISDLGYKESLDTMHQALNDKAPIVRWRAAMFIYDEGDETSLPYLEAHLEDEAFDVKLQVQMAYERIKNGESAAGSVWKQIANRNKGESL
ncbi:virulence factor [Macrococcoides caseolyticum]|uniref:virulence factor n=1 Tax=Macrococcoides caseolyticum TaxID=69966 RepID=UPI00105F114E|nr:virulence factor [Macrococcus caseolyticus]QQB05996.1 virulence factor [Macrococcus caseolyticus]TDM31386.1 virulence factor [Macrococcus caseolyticus]